MSDDDKKDLTRIEDLAEFLHDESDDSLFDDENEDETAPSVTLPSLDDLETEDDFQENTPIDSNEELPEAELVPSFEASENQEFESFSNDEFSTAPEFNPEFESSVEDDNNINVANASEESSFDQQEAEEVTNFETIDDQADEYQDNQFEPSQDFSHQEDDKPYVPQQNFEDLRQFAERISYGAVAQGGNPPFSLILRGIRYQEDAEDIQIILKEHGLVTDDNLQSIEQGLANGSLLISQISEYSAIYLAHKFRRFDLDIIVGLSDEIHPSQSYDADARGLVSKQNIRQNIHESINLDRAPVKIKNIILSTTPTLEGYTIKEYLSVISHHNILSASEIEEFSSLNITTGDEIVDAIQKDLTEVLQKHGTHDSEVLMPFGQGLETLYKEMADNLRTKALKIGANAIVGINYQLTPVFANQSGATDVQYKVTCLGSAVWVVGN